MQGQEKLKLCGCDSVSLSLNISTANGNLVMKCLFRYTVDVSHDMQLF